MFKSLNNHYKFNIKIVIFLFNLIYTLKLKYFLIFVYNNIYLSSYRIMLHSSYIKYFKTPLVGRSNNDGNNKFRELTICSMPNFDESFYDDPEFGSDWIDFSHNFNKAMKMICPNFHSYTIEYKGGRNFNYDYLFTFLDESRNKICDENVEFKYNATSIADTPQFVSPMNPSKYLSQSFEAYHYDNYFKQFLLENNLPVPERNIYINTIGNNTPECVKEVQELYYKGAEGSSKFTNDKTAINFHKKCKEMSKLSITNFIKETDLNIEALTQYLITSQNNKIYLLYKNGIFNIQRTNNDDYIIDSYTKNPDKSIYQAITKTGKKMKILLRWKNGNGIAYPAFQIS